MNKILSMTDERGLTPWDKRIVGAVLLTVITCPFLIAQLPINDETKGLFITVYLLILMAIANESRS